MAWQYTKGKGPIDLSLYGDKELIQLLKGLDKKLSDKLIWATMKKNSNRIIKTARHYLKAKHGETQMAKAIKFKRSRKYKLTGFVGPEHGKKKTNDFWYAHFLEWGTSGRLTPKRKYCQDRDDKTQTSERWLIGLMARTAKKKIGEQYRRATPGRAFMRPAFEQEGPEAQKQMMQDFRKVIESYWKRGAKKMGWLVKK